MEEGAGSEENKITEFVKITEDRGPNYKFPTWWGNGYFLELLTHLTYLLWYATRNFFSFSKNSSTSWKNEVHCQYEVCTNGVIWPCHFVCLKQRHTSLVGNLHVHKAANTCNKLTICQKKSKFQVLTDKIKKRNV